MATNGSAGEVHSSTESIEKRKFFVGGLSNDTNEEDLQTYFNQFGTVEHCVVKRDPTTQRSRGFGFVTFTTSSGVIAVRAVSNHVIKGKKVDPKPADPRPGEEAVFKIFVGGIDSSLNEEDVKAHFETYGTVKNVEWPKDRMNNNAKKNFCFVEFDDPEIVRSLLRNPKQQIGGRVCDIGKALPAGQKQFGMRGAGDFGSPFGGYGFGGGAAGFGGYGAAAGNGYAGGYGDPYAAYYGAAGAYDPSSFYDPSAFYGGYGDYSAAAGYGYGAAAGAAAYGASAGTGAASAADYTGFGPTRTGGAGALRGMGGAAAGRGAPRGFHPYKR